MNKKSSNIGGTWRIPDAAGETAALALVQDNYPEDGYAIINHLEVKEEFRQQGLGRSLLQHIFNHADKQGVTVCVDVFSQGPMTNVELIKFYEGLGFEKHRTYMRLMRKPKA